MRVFQTYFSPTGGTKRVAELVAGEWDCEHTEIDLSDGSVDFSSCTVKKEDLCVAAVPVFGGRVPPLAVSNLHKLRGNGAKAIVIAVYGNRAYEDALLELKDTMASAGFLCIAGIAAIAEHSIVHQFGAGRPDEQDKAQLTEFAEKIKGVLQRKIQEGELCVPGNKPYKEYKIMPMAPQAGPECTECGICAEECPVGAISRDNPKATEEDKCISCMRCITVCPQEARSINAVMLETLTKKLEKVCSVRKENELFLI